MRTRHFIQWICSLGLTALAAGMVSGQDFPNKPIRIVTAPPGGGNDFVSRGIAQAISGPLGQPIIVENRPVPILGGLVSKAQPDGYTLLVLGGTLVVGPLLKKMDYDPVNDFSPISLVELSISVVVVHPSVAANSIKELIALAKANPGSLNYAMAGVGSPPHLGVELFNSLTGIKLVPINYKGQGFAVTDLLGGQVHVMFASTIPVAPLIKAGKLRALAVTSAEPNWQFPGLPTVAATVPGFESISLTGVYAPAKTPDAVIRRLNQEIVKAVQRPDVKEMFLKGGVEVISSSPERLGATVKAEIARWGKVIKDANIRME